jgi:inorganic triphosphatase YgiF
MRELEVKIKADSMANLLDLPKNLLELGWELSTETVANVNDFYLDTPDLDILQSGWTFRLRKNNTASVVTLKEVISDKSGIANREEYEEAVSWDGKSAIELPEELLDGKVSKLVDGKTLWLLFEIEQARHQYIIKKEGCEAELSLDSIQWLYNKKIAEGFMAEIEYLSGDERQMLNTHTELINNYNWSPSSQSKFDIGLDLFNNF